MRMLSSRKVAAFVALAGALVLAGVLWRFAFTRTVLESRVVGNGSATLLHTETATNGLLLAGAVVAISGGVGAFVGFLAPPSAGAVGSARRRAWRRGGIAALIIAAVATTAAVAGSESSTPVADRPSLALPAFRTTSEFTAAMRAEDLACARTRRAPADGSAVAIVCSIPWPADIRDGHDDVLVTLWRSAAARDRWLTQHIENQALVVVGPEWTATCEFRSTCALILHRLRTVEE